MRGISTVSDVKEKRQNFNKAINEFIKLTNLDEEKKSGLAERISGELFFRAMKSPALMTFETSIKAVENMEQTELPIIIMLRHLGVVNIGDVMGLGNDDLMTRDFAARNKIDPSVLYQIVEKTFEFTSTKEEKMMIEERINNSNYVYELNKIYKETEERKEEYGNTKDELINKKRTEISFLADHLVNESNIRYKDIDEEVTKDLDWKEEKTGTYLEKCDEDKKLLLLMNIIEHSLAAIQIINPELDEDGPFTEDLKEKLKNNAITKRDINKPEDQKIEHAKSLLKDWGIPHDIFYGMWSSELSRVEIAQTIISMSWFLKSFRVY